MKGVVRSIHEWVEQVKSLLRGKLEAHVDLQRDVITGNFDMESQ